MTGRNIKTGRIFTDDLDTVNINLSGNFKKNGISFDPFAWKKIVNDLSYTAGKVGVGTETPDATLQIGEPSQYAIPISAWVKTIQGTGLEYIYDIAIDSIGNVYVTGDYNSISDIDLGNSVSLPSNNNSDTFIIKYNQAGTAQWANIINGSSDTSGKGIAVDSVGNVYVTGNYNSTSTIDLGNNVILQITTGTDEFIIKYNTTGTAQWNKVIKGTGTDGGNGIAVDSGGNVYVSGNYISTNTINLGNNVILPITASTDGFIVKYNTNGTAQWKQTIKGAGIDKGLGVDVDSSGNVYMTGNYNSVDIIEFGNNVSLPSTNNSDTFIIKYNTIGTAEWANTINGYSDTSGKGVAVDSGGNVYVTGDYNSISDIDLGNNVILPLTTGTDGFIVKYNTTGTTQWKQTIKGSGVDEGKGIATDSGGNVYVTGNYNSTSTIDLGNSVILPITTSTDGFIIKYNTNGTTQWYKTIHGTSNDIPRGIAIDLNGSVYVSGDYISTSTVDLGNNVILPKTLNGTSNDGFIVKYTNIPTATPDTSLFVTGNVQIGDSKLFVDTVSSKVGIGTNAPDAFLHVVGNVYTSSNLTVASNLTVSGDTVIDGVTRLQGATLVSNVMTIGTTKTFVVRAVVGAYYIDEVLRKPLILHENQTYIFDLSHSSLASGAHPFSFSTVATDGSGTVYSAGITTTGTAGTAGAKITFVVPPGTTSPIYYYCSVHNGMGSTMSISSTPVLMVSGRIESKDLEVTGTDGITISGGTTAERPVNALIGTLRYNSTIGYMEVYTVGGWNVITTSPRIDTISPTNTPAQTGFTAGFYHQDELHHWDPDNSDYFGISVSISLDGTRAVVGAYQEDGDPTAQNDFGSAHIFTRLANEDFWTHEAQISHPNPSSNDEFGYSVSISNDGNRVIVGARYDDLNSSNDNMGSAHIFVRDANGSWTWEDELRHPTPGINDYFGESVSISGDGNRAIVGAYADDVSNSDQGSAQIFVRDATTTPITWTHEKELTHANVAGQTVSGSDHFGSSVSISNDGTLALVGARYTDSPAGDSGSAYVFIRNTGTNDWTLEQRLLHNDPQDNDYFGHCVSISGDGTRAIVGAYTDNDIVAPYTNDTGSAHIFRRDTTTSPITWIYEKDIRHTSSMQTVNSSDQFGYSVSISNDGNRVIAGARYTDLGGGDAGSAYIFDRDTGTNDWTFNKMLVHPQPSSSNHFGESVSMSGDGTHVIVGVPYDDGTTIDGLKTLPGNAGTAQVFNLKSEILDTSTQIFTVTGADFHVGSTVQLVGVDGTLYSVFDLTISANTHDSQITFKMGAFGTSGGYDLAQRPYKIRINNPNTGKTTTSNTTITLAGGWTTPSRAFDFSNTDLISYTLTGVNATGVNNVSTFTLAPESNPLPGGLSLGPTTGILSGILTGATARTEMIFRLKDDINDGFNDRIFVIEGSTSQPAITAISPTNTLTSGGYTVGFHHQDELYHPNPDSSDNFGESVSISLDGTRAIVGVPREATSAYGSQPGGAHIFTRLSTDDFWTHEAQLLLPNARNSDQFGYSVSISNDGNRVIVGARYDDIDLSAINQPDLADAGSAHIFVRDASGSWTWEDELRHPSPGQSDYFGESVSISGDGNRAIVGAYADDVSNSDQGSAQIFVRDATTTPITWTHEKELTHANVAGQTVSGSDHFGSSVSISNDGTLALVGARYTDSPAGDSGSAYVFIRNTGTNDWTLEQRLLHNDPQDNDYFGHCVSISGDGTRAIVGAYTDNDIVAPYTNDTGSAHIFRRDTTTSPITWIYEKDIRHTSSMQTVNSSDQFGYSVSISNDGNRVIAGARYTDLGGGDAGSAYIFDRDTGTNDWTFNKMLVHPQPASSDYFGRSVSMSGDGTYVIVGARADDGTTIDGLKTLPADAGTAQVFNLKDHQLFDTSTQIFTVTGTGFTNGSLVQLVGANGTLYSVFDVTAPNAAGTEITFKMGALGTSGGYDVAQQPYTVKVNSTTGLSVTSTATINTTGGWTTASRVFNFFTTAVTSYTLTGTAANGATGAGARSFTLAPASNPLPAGISLASTTGILSGQAAGASSQVSVIFRLTDLNTQLFEDRTFVIQGFYALYPFTSHTFTAAGVTGRNGPAVSQLRNSYVGENNWWDNSSYFGVEGSYNGVQKWTVPASGTYVIEAAGSSTEWARWMTSYYYPGGYGALITGTFTLTEGEIIKIVVGQVGEVATHSQDGNAYLSGGGGGSFVVRTPYNTTASILVIAGGGGGASGYGQSSPGWIGIDAVTTSSGTAGGNGGDAGGSSGLGGQGSYGGGGAGFLGSGATPSGTSSSNVSKSFTNGSGGGQGARSWGGGDAWGGFGGGGGSGGGLAAGGGGGYSGGGGGQWSTYQQGGGGGSYNSGIYPLGSIRTVRNQNGYVKITKL